MALSTPQRVHYFDHQFLRADDLSTEQEYQVAMRRLHNRILHTYGVAYGLDVPYNAGATDVKVLPGVAIDSEGREIVLEAEQTIPGPASATESDYYVTIAYGEQNADHTNETGAEGDTRTTETPVLAMDPTEPAEDVLVLAKVHYKGKQVTKIDTSVRRLAGVAATSLALNELMLSHPTIDTSHWVHMRLASTDHAAVEGSLVVTGSLSVGGATDPGDGNAAFSGSLDVGGKISAGAGLSVAGGPLSVGKASIDPSGSVSAPGGVSVTGGGLSVTGGGLSVTGGGLQVGSAHIDQSGNAVLPGTLAVAGTLEVDKTLTAKGGLSVSGGPFTVGGVTIDPQANALSVDNTAAPAPAFRENMLYLSSSPGPPQAPQAQASSITYNAYRDNKGAWAFPHPKIPAVTIEMDTYQQVGRFEVYTTTSEDPAPTNWNRRLRVDGDTGEVTVDNALTVAGTISAKGKVVIYSDIEIHGNILTPSGDLNHKKM